MMNIQSKWFYVIIAIIVYCGLASGNRNACKISGLVSRAVCGNENIFTIQRQLKENFVQKFKNSSQFLLSLFDVSFPLGIMDKDWYNLSIKESNIARLNIESCNISKIREGAFNTTLLSFLTSLRLVDLPITFFEDGTFIGLESLKILWLEKLKITSLSPMLFDSLHSLKHFIVADCNPQRMDVSNMSGREKRPHKKLQSIVFNNNNLGDTIGENTFLGILQLETINLDNNRIESIGPGVLNALPPSLKKLILSNNKLKVLPSGLANLLKTSSKIRIFLRNNPWKCDCNLQFLLYAMTTNHQNFDGKVVKCASPLKYAGKVLISIPYLCSSIDSDESGPVASQIHSNSIVSPTKTSADLSSEQLDISYPDVSIEKPQRNIRVEQSLNGEHSLFISEFPFDHYILGFENNEIIVEDSKFRQSSCIANDLALQTKNVRISLELKSDRVYKFCVMKKDSMETSPFNCVSLYTNPTKQENLSSSLRCRIAVTALWIIVAVIFLTFVIIKNFSTSSRRPAIKEKEENTNGSDSPAKEIKKVLPIRESTPVPPCSCDLGVLVDDPFADCKKKPDEESRKLNIL